MRIIKKFRILLPKNQQKKVVILIIMMIISALLEVVGVGLIIPLMTAIMDENCIENVGYISSICQTLGISSHRSFVLLCLLSLMVLYIVKDLYIILQNHLQLRFIFNQRLCTQRRVFEAYLTRPYEFFLNTSYPEVTKVLCAYVLKAYSLLATMMGLISELVVAAAMIITVLIINPMMTAIVAASMMVCMLIISIVIKPKMREAGEKQRVSSEIFTRWIFQAIRGIKEVKITNTEKFFTDHFMVSGKTEAECIRQNQVWSMIPRLIIEMISVNACLLSIIIMIFAGQSVASLIPAISAFAMAAVKLLPSANRIVAAVNQIAFDEPALDALIEELTLLDERIAKESQRVEYLEKRLHNENIEYRVTDIKEGISLNNITYKYPLAEENVLENIHMEIPVGMSIGIVGTSGAGKSTAVDIMLGLLMPEKGQVLCDGIDVLDDYTGWISHIGYIPQTIFLLDGNIRENVAFGLDPSMIDDDKVWKALEQAQMGDFVRSVPDGLYHRIGEGGIRLSGGQRQRLGVARALYNNPDILVFDEATSALDNETEAAIMDSINALHGVKTMIIIAHRLTTIEGCDMVYRVGDKKVIRER